MLSSNQKEKHWVNNTLIWKAATPIDPGSIFFTTSRTVGSFQGGTQRQR